MDMRNTKVFLLASLTAGGLLLGNTTMAQAAPMLETTSAGTQTAHLMPGKNALTISTLFLIEGTVNTKYSWDLTASGGTAPYSWRVSAGSLPSGLVLSGKGKISGTPQKTGTSNLTITVTDAKKQTSSKSFTLIVRTPIVITTSYLPNAKLGRPDYKAVLKASGGDLSFYIWGIIEGKLPAGLSLDPKGIIYGTATKIGTYGFTVAVANSAFRQTSKKLSITVVK